MTTMVVLYDRFDPLGFFKPTLLGVRSYEIYILLFTLDLHLVTEANALIFLPLCI